MGGLQLDTANTINVNSKTNDKIQVLFSSE